MKIKRRTKIISETTRKFSFAINRQPVRFFCAECGAPAEMLSINEAARRRKTVWRAIVRAVENGELHFTETDGGEIYICAASLLEKTEFNQIGENK